MAVCVNQPGDSNSMLGSVSNLVRQLTNGAAGEPLALTDVQRKELRDSYGTIAENESPLTIRSGWELVLERIPTEIERETLFSETLPVLNQFFSISSQLETTGIDNAQAIVRVPLLDSELTAEERRMAESLTSIGVVCRRISDSNQSVFEIVDDSILSGWAALNKHVETNRRTITLRDNVRAARRAWENSGRRQAALADVQLEEDSLTLNDDVKSWIGKPNLIFLDAVIVAKSVRDHVAELERAVAASIEQCRINNEENQGRFEELAQEKSAALQSYLEIERKRESSSRRRALYFTIGAVLLTGVGVAINTNLATKENVVKGQLESAQATLKVLAAESAALKEARVFEAQGRALNIFEHAKELYRKQDFVSALLEFDKAIEVYGNFPSAYLERAKTRIKLRQRSPRSEVATIKLELEDYAVAYNLSPNLSGRANLALEALKEPTIEIPFVKAQLTALLVNATEQWGALLKADKERGVDQRTTKSLTTQIEKIADNLEKTESEISRASLRIRANGSELVPIVRDTIQALRILVRPNDSTISLVRSSAQVKNENPALTVVTPAMGAIDAPLIGSGTNRGIENRTNDAPAGPIGGEPEAKRSYNNPALQRNNALIPIPPPTAKEPIRSDAPRAR